LKKKLAIEGGAPVRTEPMLFDARFGQPHIGDEEIQAVVEVLKSKRLSQVTGTKVDEFEEAFAKYHGVKHARATSSGTTALHGALATLEIGPGDEVIVPALTFIATAFSVLHQNAIPVFADVDSKTYNIDPNDIERKISPRTKAIIPVHLLGHPAAMDRIMEIADEHDLAVIEDNAQSVGSEYKGRKTGTFGDLGCFSFYQTKNMTTGEGGMIITDDDNFAERVRMIRQYGETAPSEREVRTYHHEILGYNYRMGEIQAAIGLVQLKKLDDMNQRRIENANYLSDHLTNVKGITTPFIQEGAKHVFYAYPIRLDLEELGVSADWFAQAMTAEGIPTFRGAGTPTPLYLQHVFINLSGYGRINCPFSCPFYEGKVKYGKGICPTSEKLVNEVVILPLNPLMTRNDLDDIVTAIKKILGSPSETYIKT